MKESEQKKTFQEIVDHRLCSLKGNPFLAQRIIAESKGEQPIMKKKISVGLVLTIAIMLIAAAALAAGLMFSPRYDAAKLANEALLSKYGITDKMMTIFHREVTQGADGNSTVTYTSVEGILDNSENLVGVYTVTVKDGHADAVWSHDGQDTSGGLKAKAWGSEQLKMMVTDYGTVMTYLMNESSAHPVAAHAGSPAVTPPAFTYENEQKAAENKKKVGSAAKLTLAMAKENALLAFESEYDLSSSQIQLLEVFDGEETYQVKNGRPLVSLYYHLSQGNEWMEKDGIYVVTVNMETGEIEDMLYDSGLAANG